MLLSGKTAIITGASKPSGIGRAIAIAFASQGADIVVADLEPLIEQAQSLVKEIEAIGRKAIAVPTNVTKGADAESLVEQAVSEFGKVDILVNNAGITRDGLLMRMKEEDWDSVMAVNLKGVFNCTKAVIKPMIKARTGRIVNIASVVGIIGNPGQANYSASKAGVIGFTKTMARELASRSINVNAIAPGFIQTDMTHVLSDDAKGKLSSQIPLGILGKPEDIANTAVFLCSDLSSYITGQVINVDGGMVM